MGCCSAYLRQSDPSIHQQSNSYGYVYLFVLVMVVGPLFIPTWSLADLSKSAAMASICLMTAMAAISTIFAYTCFPGVAKDMDPSTQSITAIFVGFMLMEFVSIFPLTILLALSVKFVFGKGR